jgi:hypothetical protein
MPRTRYQTFRCPVARIEATYAVTLFELSGIGDERLVLQRDLECEQERECEVRGLLARCPVRKANERLNRTSPQP